ncbi:MAG: acyl-CoA dehydrogenase [Xanthomonadales bacterium]|nr:acyl-CoA dehydrogenase [Xanthomonadales bacterium]
MSNYQHPYKDAVFILKHLLELEKMCDQAGLDDINMELADAILEEAARLGSEVFAPLNSVGDQQGAKLGENGVEETPGFADAYRQYAQSGWASLAAAEQYGGQNMPKMLEAAVTEIWDTANLSLALCPMLTTGAVDAITAHASDELKDRYLPAMVSGEWAGSMCLTESGAGSDLAAIITKAVPEGEHYLISGQKIFITWGDHQMTENIIHLVLARLPDAPAGVRGISLFLVPKFLLDDNGKPSQRNDAYCVGIEHKLGIHGSPTCTLNFGDNGGAVGYLVGKEHNGLMAMFTMMNEARQGVGMQALGVSERSFQQARTFAKERIQGTRKDGSRYPIIEFPDVRRMLMLMKSATEAMRALLYTAASEADRSHWAESAEAAKKHATRNELYTPIVKGWCTELAQEITSYGVQIHGGMGYVEETGIAQHLRDARILTIYEGTTGIQGLDLAGRKILLDKGEALQDLLDEIQATADAIAAVDDLNNMADALTNAVNAAREAGNWLLENATEDKHAMGSSSVNLMMLLGFVCGGWVMGQATLKAAQLLETGSDDSSFLATKQFTAQFYFEHFLPRSHSYLATIKAGSGSMMALDAEQF